MGPTETPPPVGRLRRGVRALLGPAAEVLGWVGLAVGVAGLLARSVAVGWQPAVIAAAASVYLAGGAVVGGVLLAARRRRTGVVVAAAVAVVTLVVHVPWFVATSPRRGADLVVLQANLGVGGTDPDALVGLVRDRAVDVLTTDELTPAALDRLGRAGLDTALPYRFVTPYPGGAGTGIWSRHPLSETAAHDEFRFELLTARVAVPGAVPIAVAAVHLLPPWPYPSSTWLAELRRLRVVLRDLAAGSPAVVASGDFNAGLDNPQLRDLLDDGFHDAGDQAGGGFAPTYPTDRFTGPLLVLDHVLTRGADAAAVRTVALPGSDHRGLLVTLRVPTG